MGQTESREVKFLAKVKQYLLKFDELDEIDREVMEMINSQPENQSQVDQELSDYYHIIENDDLTDVQLAEVGKRIKDARIRRRDESCTASLIKCFKDNKNKLQYSVKANRVMFENAMSRQCKTLHEDYKYRVLSEDDIKNIKNVKEKNTESKKSNRKFSIPEIVECFEHKMKNKDIAKKLDITQSYVSVMRKKLGYAKVK